jgi:nicotinamidase-related amidase
MTTSPATSTESTTQGIALLILDMQNDMIYGGHEGSHDSMVRVVDQLRHWAYDHHVPVIYTRVAYLPSYADANPMSPAIKRGNLQQGQPGADVIDTLQPRPEDVVIIKRRVGAFYGTELELLLRGLKVHTLVVAGTSTSRAVESTVREAHSRDFSSIVVSDGTFAGDQQFHDASLRVMGAFFGEVLTADQVMERFA